MASINSTPSHVAKIGYNGFAMDNLLKFSSTTGELLPVYYDFLQPDDKVSLRTELRTRTMELESAAMCKLREHIEWFFVPLNQLYSIFGDTYFGIQDFKSSLFDPASVQPDIPYVPVGTSSGQTTYELALVQGAADAYFASPHLDSSSNRIPYIGTGFRILELLGIPIYDYANLQQATSNREVMNLSICPLLACAYQKIYFDFYRLSDREPNDPRAYSLDSFYNTGLISTLYLANFYRLRYRPWSKDFFTNLFTSPLFGSTGIGSFGYSVSPGSPNIQDMTKSFRQWLTATNFNTYSQGGWTDVNTQSPNPSGRYEMSSNTSSPTQVAPSGIGSSANQTLQLGNLQQALSPTSIRTSFAVQKLLEITRRAGKHYDKQVLAHFGADVPTGIAGEVIYLGGSVTDINIGDVIATAGTQSDPLGKVAGKGYGYGSSKPIKFTAPCHGVLMAIFSVEPVADYSMKWYDKLNGLITRADWFSPEYDNLGPQPLFAYQDQYNPLSGAMNNYNIEGWQWRYSELKCKQNRVCGALMRSLGYWSPQRDLYEEDATWQSTVSRYLISPFYLDPIMLKNYEFDASRLRDETDPDDPAGYQDLFDSDPLIHELFFDVKKSSKMSTYGLEQL